MILLSIRWSLSNVGLTRAKTGRTRRDKNLHWGKKVASFSAGNKRKVGHQYYSEKWLETCGFECIL